MFPNLNRNEGAYRRPRSSALRASLEGLEERLLLYSTLGGQWVFGERITYSFAPDETDVGGQLSNLHQTMADQGITEVAWKNAFRRAAATWQSVAGINLVEVPDDGTNLGAPGHQQGDPRFGDIRIFGVPDEPHVLAGAFLPPPINGGTIAGDIIFNTDQPWMINGTFDIMTVALHEFGHSLGLDHSTESNAAMHHKYESIKKSLHIDDIDGIRLIYGARQHDDLDAWFSNNSVTTASNLTGQVDSNAQLSVPNLDITTLSDRDWIYVQAPANAVGTMTITVQSTGLSSLSPRVDVYNAWWHYAGTAIAPNAANTYGASASISFSGVPAGTGVYLRVAGWNFNNSGPNGVGTYGLQVNFSGQPMAPFDPPNTVVEEQPDQAGGSSNLETHGHDPLHAMGGFDGLMNGRRHQSDVFTIDPGFRQSPRPVPPVVGRRLDPPLPLDPVIPVSPDTVLVFPRPGNGRIPSQAILGRLDSTPMIWLLPTPSMDAVLHQLANNDQDSEKPGPGRWNGRFTIDDDLVS
ncbi:hypothetical protein BH23PLA1_BH23PLA1_21650 [soil metagenome]